jgi:hypothetical protein
MILGIFIAQTIDVRGFDKLYVQREENLLNQLNAMPVIHYKGYSQRQLYNFYGYSDEHMISRKWMLDLYSKKYGIRDIKLANDTLHLIYLPK